MICPSVSISVEEDQFPGMSSISCSFMKKTPAGQGIRPSGRFAVIGQFITRDSGIEQAEGNKHCIPLPVGFAVPCAEAVPSVQIIGVSFFVVNRLEVPDTLRISHLTLCNGEQVPGPISTECQICEQFVPDFRILHIRKKVAFRWFRNIRRSCTLCKNAGPSATRHKEETKKQG